MTSQQKIPTTTEILQAAVHSFERGEFDLASIRCQQLLNTKTIPSVIEFNALHLLGVISLKQKNYLEANKLLTQAVKLQPTHVMALNALGCTQLEMGNPEAAIATLQQCSQLAPK